MLTVILKDGTKITEPIQPHTNLKGWDAVNEKFEISVTGCLGKDQRQEVLDVVPLGAGFVSQRASAKSACRLDSFWLIWNHVRPGSAERKNIFLSDRVPRYINLQGMQAWLQLQSVKQMTGVLFLSSWVI